MNNLQKEKYFDQLHDKVTNPAFINNVGNQSIEIKLACGCKSTQHPLVRITGKYHNTKYKADPKFDLERSIEFEYFEFCDNHKNKLHV